MTGRLVDHNGHEFTCTVNSDAGGSTIHLKNTETGDEWTCSVTNDNINDFWALPASEGSIVLANLPRAVVGIMQDVLHQGTTSGRYTGSVSLVYKYSPFYMELRVKCPIVRATVEWVEWAFPMVPKAVGAIEKRLAAAALENDAAIKNVW